MRDSCDDGMALMRPITGFGTSSSASWMMRHTLEFPLPTALLSRDQPCASCSSQCIHMRHHIVTHTRHRTAITLSHTCVITLSHTLPSHCHHSANTCVITSSHTLPSHCQHSAYTCVITSSHTCVIAPSSQCIHMRHHIVTHIAITS